MEYIFTYYDHLDLAALKKAGIKNLAVGLEHCTLGNYGVYPLPDDFNTYILCNTLYTQKDLPVLKEALRSLKKVSGVLFQDYAVLNLLRGSGIPLIYAANSLNTHHKLFDVLKKIDVDMVFVSRELTLPELVEIGTLSSLPLMVQIAGAMEMAISRRKLLSAAQQYYHQPASYQKIITPEDSDLETIAQENESGTRFVSRLPLDWSCYQDLLGSYAYGFVETLGMDTADVIATYQALSEKKPLPFASFAGFAQEKTIYTPDEVRKAGNG